MFSVLIYICFFSLILKSVQSGIISDLDRQYGKVVFTNIGTKSGKGPAWFKNVEPVERALFKEKSFFLNELYRHGESLPNNPFLLYPSGLGQLTDAGKQNQFRLGKWLRNTYGELLSNKFDNKEITITSTDEEKSLQSAEANTAGLYAPKSVNNLNGGINWQPVPVKTIPEDQDRLLAMRAHCQKYETVFHKYRMSKEFRELTQKYVGLNRVLEQKIGQPFDLMYANYFYSLFTYQEKNGIEPAWFRNLKQSDRDLFKQEALFVYEVLTHLTELKRLRGGPLLKAMLGDMNNKRYAIEQGMEDKKAMVYSGYDITISSLLNTMGVFTGQAASEPPPFSSAVMVELRKKQNQYFVTILYKMNVNNEEPIALSIPGCFAEGCPLETTNLLLKPVIPENWVSECHQRTPYD